MTEAPTAESLSRTSPPDIRLGRLSLWIAGPKGHDGWLDVAVLVGDDYDTIARTSGMMLQKKDLAAFEPALRAVADADTGEALLWSDGGSLTIRVKRWGREHGNYVEVGLRRSIYDQKISFGFAVADYAGALVGLRAVLTRLDEQLERSRRLLPRLDPEPAWKWPARQVEGEFLPSDFPAEADAANQKGVAEVHFTVSREGVPERIELADPTSIASLDAATLAIVAERFRYEPARDANGEPVPQRRRRKIAWLLRRDGPVVLDAAEPDFEYIIDGVGWMAVHARIGTKEGGAGGSSWMTEPMADLLRAGTALAGGVRRIEIGFNAEPFLSRLEFEVETLNSSVMGRGEGGRWTATDACWIRARDIDHFTMEPSPEPDFEALAYSPLAVAEAIYSMALPLFEQNDRGDFPEFAALVAAIAAARRG
jgi:TonB family protein